jgi:hypothetical protein
MDIWDVSKLFICIHHDPPSANEFLTQPKLDVYDVLKKAIVRNNDNVIITLLSHECICPCG